MTDEPDETLVVPSDDRRTDARSDQLAPGSWAGGYEIRRTIAAGGCGTVYVAEHRVLGRQVALKVLHRHLAGQAQFELRFIQEARAVNRIRHPNIVDIHEFGKLDDGRPFYVMELVEGAGLDQYLAARGAMPPAEALALLDPICDALQAAHDAGVIHRDVKASNVILVGGSVRHVKLVDFGIAKLVTTDPAFRGLTVVGQRLGTPQYMAPEQVRGDPADARVDVYALGVLLFRMLTGQLPFSAREAAEVERMQLETPPPPPSRFAPVPPAVDAVVLRALSKDAATRFGSVDALRVALRDAVAAPAERPAETARAIGIYAEVRLADLDAELDDEVALELTTALAVASDALIAAGFRLALETSTAVLGVREPADADGAIAAVALVRALQPADPRIRIDACAHVAEARLLLDVAAWSPEPTTTCVTGELAHLAGVAGTGRYVSVG